MGGSISACAEEPSRLPGGVMYVEVDLRMRGGAVLGAGTLAAGSGRSPHARRSPEPTLCGADCLRSISACAEEPTSASKWARPARVDLRMRGGARSR